MTDDGKITESMLMESYSRLMGHLDYYQSKLGDKSIKDTTKIDFDKDKPAKNATADLLESYSRIRSYEEYLIDDLK